MSRTTSALLGLLMTALTLVGPVTPAYAVVSRPLPIDASVPTEWHARLAQFLREFGMRDVETVLANMKGGPIGMVSRGTVIIRVEDKAVCFQDSCLTIIGYFDDQAFHSEVQFVAGRMMTIGDVLMDPFGNPGPPPLWFLRTDDFANDPSIVTLLKTKKGWIVVPPAQKVP